MANPPATTHSRQKTVVLCFDGTSNQFGPKNTNIVKFCSLLNKHHPLKQVVYYQPGIGTYVRPGVISPALEWAARWLDDLFAWCVHDHIMDGYKFLMQNYHKGDRICLFGFSRGAYTARALAAFINKIGLLARDNCEQVPFAYKLNCRGDKEGEKLAGEFKRAFCSHATVDFLGVWDTVASLGTLYSRGPSIKETRSSVAIFRHALSLDERRARFQPSLCILEQQEIEALRQDPADRNPTSGGPAGPPPIPRVLEVWFPGCHSDVGGGAVGNDKHHSFAKISLLWMVRQVTLSDCGVLFDPAAMGAILGVPTVGSPAHAVPTTGTDFLSSVNDEVRSIVEAEIQTIVKGGTQAVVDGVNDEIKKAPWKWWFLEIFPVKYEWQDANGKWEKKWGINRWRGRRIRENNPIFHSSVHKRIEATGGGYRPKARWARGTERYTEGDMD